VHLLGNGVTFDEGALVEPFACAVHLCRLLQPARADRLPAHPGSGADRAARAGAARQYGLRDVTVIDRNEERLEIARQMGAVTATDSRALTGERGTAAVDAVGLGVTRASCMESVRPG
jgi:threonine dehydrogenase-like Zn-dependent dehydrogenase